MFFDKMKKILVVLLLIGLVVPAQSVYAIQDGYTPSGIPFSMMEDQIDALVNEYLGITTPGAAVVIVHEGEVIFEKGYGYADVEKGIPVDPATTVFEYGSAGKTFVWVSVMQLVEQGLLDLDADLATYLPTDFYDQLTYEKPITMRDLMNHSAGFGGRLLDLMVDVNKAGDPESLDEVLLRAQPEQIYDPGMVSAYSNFGAAFAARVTGIRLANRPRVR